jgi:cytochrome P450
MGARHEHEGAVDPFDREFIRCPFPTYDRLRSTHPVAYIDHGKGFWLVSRHALVDEVARDAERFSSQSGPLGSTRPSPAALARMAEIDPPGGLPGLVPTLLTLDPPGHSRNRRLISRAFSPAAARGYEAVTRRIGRDLIARFADGVPADFVRDFAVPLPIGVIAAALDVPDDGVDDVKRWSDAAVGAIGTDLTDDEFVENHRRLLELAAFLQGQIDAKRAREPTGDVLSRLVHARLSDEEAADFGADAPRGLTDDEIHSIVRQLLVAGNETTSNLLTQLIVRLASEPSWWDRMHEDPELIPAVVEEALRLASPSAVNQRAARHATELAGAHIEPGDIVLVGYLAANHDPDVFPEPERFDPTRPNLSDHVAFGRGIHFCPGASVARMEARIALEELTSAFAGYRIPPTEGLAWNRSFQLRAMTAVPFTPHVRF